MTIFDNWVWGAPQWAGIALGVGGLLALLVIWNYFAASTIPAVGWLAAALKLVAISLLAVCLLQPMRSGTRPKPQANLFPILVDNSQSMGLRLSPGMPTLGETTAKLVDPETAWRKRLAQDFDVRTYSFDARLESVREIDKLASDGWASSLGGSIDQLSTRLGNRPVAGALLFTDGNATDANLRDRDWSQVGFPVYPVAATGTQRLVDLRVADVVVTQSDFETAPVTVRVSLQADEMDGQEVVVQLFDLAGGVTVEEQTVTLGAKSESEAKDRELTVTFRFRPLESGVRFYRVAAFRPADRDKWESETATGEVTYRNNSRLVTVDGSRGPYRVLYLAGRPNWEFKFLRRAIQEDAETELVGLLRIADKEAKFSFRDREVSTVNPLFAGGAEPDDETAQQYDEAVLVRLGVRDADELTRGFPQTADELFRYHAIILDDIEAEFFSQDQLLLIRRFVAARGGGLLLLGGQESFAGKRFAQGALGELSPVYPPRADSDRAFSFDPAARPFRFELTREGMVQPWVRLRDNEKGEAERLQNMPPFQMVSPIGTVKPGASVLALVRTIDGDVIPALVTQRFGKGRTAALPMTDLWRWSMRRPRPELVGRNATGLSADKAKEEKLIRDDPAQAWRQVTRWLVNEAPRRVECNVIASDDATVATRVVTTVNDESFLPLENANVELEIEPPTGEAFKATATADFDSPGQYVSTHWAIERGGYLVNVRVTSEDGTEIGTAQAGWTADPAAAEFRNLGIHRELLQRIADATGGELIEADALDEFVSGLPSRKVPVTQTWVYPIWHRPWVMFVAILCLCGEWGLRRWKGMP